MLEGQDENLLTGRHLIQNTLSPYSVSALLLLLASSQFFAVSWHPQVADLQGLGLPLQALLQFESVLGQQCAESGHVAVTQP